MASIISSLFRGSSLLGGAKELFSQGGQTRIGDVVIDCTLKETIKQSSEVTEHPIESKTAISDHIFKNPLRVSIEGYITDSPIKIMGLFETPLQNNSPAKLLNSFRSFVPFVDTEKPSRQAYKLLQSIWKERQLINLVTKMEAFNDMCIESLEFSSDEDTGGRLQFTAELVQIVYSNVKTTTFNVNTKYKDLESVTAFKVDRGITEKVPPSYAASGVDWLGTKLSNFKSFLNDPENRKKINEGMGYRTFEQDAESGDMLLRKLRLR